MKFRKNIPGIRFVTSFAVMLCLLLLSDIFGSWPIFLVEADATLPPIDPPTRVPDNNDDDDDNNNITKR